MTKQYITKYALYVRHSGYKLITMIQDRVHLTAWPEDYKFPEEILMDRKSALHLKEYILKGNLNCTIFNVPDKNYKFNDICKKIYMTKSYIEITTKNDES